MAVNVAYVWTQRTAPDFLNNLLTAESQFAPAIASSPDGTRYFGAWSDIATADVRGRLVGNTGVPTADEFLVNSTVAGSQTEPSIAALDNSTWVVSFTDFSTDLGGDVRFRRFDFNGNPLGNDAAFDASDGNDSESDVTALTDGGFAIAYTRAFGGGDLDIHVQRFHADGTENGVRIFVDEQGPLSTRFPSIAGLAFGGFVVAWEQEPAAGGDTSVWFQRYDASGAAAGGHVLIDGQGLFNQGIEVAALQDGGFVVAYEDSSWDTNDGLITGDITVQFYNADGTPRSARLRANDNNPQDNTEFNPSLTVLSNGFVVVGWSDFNLALHHQAYDPGGFPAGTNYLVDGSVFEGEIAALTSGLVANVHQSTIDDSGVTSSIRHSIHELSRTISSDAADDTLAGDSLRDTLLGNAGADLLIPRGGNDTVDGGTGLDTISYADATQAVVVDLAFNIALGAEIGTDAVTRVENVITGSGNDAVGANGAANVLDGRGGSDTVSYYAASGPVIIDLAANVGVDPTSIDVLVNFENANGSGFNDAISGTAAANVLNGLGGNDTVSYYLAAGPVTINLAAGTANDGTSIDTLLNIENANGSSFGDVIIGDGGNNILNGLGGGDALTGNGGLDTFVQRVGEANGDVVADFDGAGAAAGDTFVFVGFGTAAQGATFTPLNATQWQIHSGLDGHNEIITLGNSAVVDTSDVVFV
jgi:hypothetical protein